MLDKTKEMANLAVEAIADKKGTRIVSLDLSKIDGASFSKVIICSGRSTSQVSAIAESVSEKLNKELKEKPSSIQGMRNAQWIILDYGSLAVNVFLPETRTYYDLEGLWSDAPAEWIADED